MPDINELRKQLSEMPRKQYFELIRKVDDERRQTIESQEKTNPLNSKMTKDEFARWIIRRHFAIDKGLSRILYLPKDASEQEVRLLEINELAHIPEGEPVEAADFMPDIDEVRFTLLVADVTPRQFDAIRNGSLKLPKAWELAESQEFFPSDQ